MSVQGSEYDQSISQSRSRAVEGHRIRRDNGSHYAVEDGVKTRNQRAKCEKEMEMTSGQRRADNSKVLCDWQPYLST